MEGSAFSPKAPRLSKIKVLNEYTVESLKNYSQYVTVRGADSWKIHQTNQQLSVILSPNNFFKKLRGTL